MKNKYPNIAFFFILSWCISGCNEINIPPSCTILYPVNETIVAQGEIINITAEATDKDGFISELRFFIDNKGVYSSRVYPSIYKWNTTGKNKGDYTIQIVAIDDEGATDSSEVKIILSAGGETGDVKDIEGNTYKTVKIGNQWWMAENLNTGHYADGTSIPLIVSQSEWEKEVYNITNAKAYCYYDFKTRNESDTLGALYTWITATNGLINNSNILKGPQGICPEGWHLPTDNDWKQLEMNLGMDPIEVNGIGYRGSDEGAKLKTSSPEFWTCPNSVSTNESGFSALPGGKLWRLGFFENMGSRAYFWTSTTENAGTMAWYRIIDCQIESVYRNKEYKKDALSVRCVRD